MSLLTAIGTRYRELTANEKRIFNLMNEDVKGFALKSIGDIAKDLSISKTTLMRFAKNAGFSGYAEFRKALQQEVLLEISPARKMREVITGEYDFNLEELFEREQANLQSTYSSLCEKDLAELCDLITGAREIHTLSWGVSTNIAEIFALRMKLMGIRCNTIRRSHGTLVEESSLLGADDLVLVFEVPPYNKETIDAVRLLAGRSVTIILVTDSPRCPLTEYARLSFFCATDAIFFGNSLSGPLFWVNLVSSLVIYRRKDKVLETLEEQQKIFNDPTYYHQ